MPEHSSYHGTITGDEAQHRLRQFNTRGYLTRFSRTKDCYVLSVYEPDTARGRLKPYVQHFKITTETVPYGGIWGWLGSKKDVYQIDHSEMNFDSLDEMLYYYEKNRIDPGFQDIGIRITKEKYSEKNPNLALIE